MTRQRPFCLAISCGFLTVFALGGCAATGTNKSNTPSTQTSILPSFLRHQENVDKQFKADAVSKSALDRTARDISARADSPVTILVKYAPDGDYASTEALAQTQATQIKEYLVSQAVKQPIKTVTSPVGKAGANDIWISYHAVGRSEPEPEQDTYGPVKPKKQLQTTAGPIPANGIRGQSSFKDIMYKRK